MDINQICLSKSFIRLIFFIKLFKYYFLRNLCNLQKDFFRWWWPAGSDNNKRDFFFREFDQCFLHLGPFCHVTRAQLAHIPTGGGADHFTSRHFTGRSAFTPNPTAVPPRPLPRFPNPSCRRRQWRRRRRRCRHRTRRF